MTKHAETPSVPVRSEHGEETETIVDINPPPPLLTQGQSSGRKVHLSNTFKGGPTIRNVFLFCVNRDVSEAIVKKHMNGKDLKYVSIKTMSKAEAVFKSFFFITVKAKDYGTFINPDVWPSGTRLSNFRMPHG